MVKKTRFRPEVASLEGRALLSAGLVHRAPHAHVVTIESTPKVNGTIAGTFVGNLATGQATVKGSGTIKGLGATKLTGVLSLSTSGDQGQGTLVLKGRKGSITLGVQGSLSAASLTKSSFPYTIVSGTGLYADATGSGIVTVAGKLKSPASLKGTFTARFHAS